MTEGTTVSTHEEHIMERIKTVEAQIKRYCDFIPLSNWGFDEDTLDFLREKKHKVVDGKLSDQEKLHLSNVKKQKVARAMGSVCSTVSEVFDFLGNEGKTSTLPKKVILKKPEKVDKSEARKSGKSVESSNTQVGNVNDSNAEEGEEAGKSTEKKKIKFSHSNDKKGSKSSNDAVEKASKPVAAVKPTPRKETSQKQDGEPVENMDDTSIIEPAKPIDEDGNDSTDEEIEIAVKSGSIKRKLPVKTDMNVKKSKIDKELEKFENVDVSTLDPIESRKVAMLKLQKKLELMKVSRIGSKQTSKLTPAKREEERKMKRRMSKLKGKQKRAQEKANVSEKAELKPKVAAPKDGDLPRTDEGNIVYSKFDFIVKEDKKKKLSEAEKRGKFTGKDYKALLKKVEKRDEKLATLHQNDPEKAKEMEEDIKWNRVLRKAEGVKVKDNVELLKKGLMKKEKLKQKKLGKWDDRVEKVKTDKSAKQDKRSSNLQKRVDDKKKKKLQKMRKKGRIL